MQVCRSGSTEGEGHDEAPPSVNDGNDDDTNLYTQMTAAGRPARGRERGDDSSLRPPDVNARRRGGRGQTGEKQTQSDTDSTRQQTATPIAGGSARRAAAYKAALAT